MNILLSQHGTPIGPMTAAALGGRLVLLEFNAARDRITRFLEQRSVQATIATGDPLNMAARLEAYFDQRDFQAFDNLELDAAGPDFHRKVWRLLRDIPAGVTRSYGDLAKKLGTPGAARAVGYANSQNPIAIAVPCHRVIGSNGTLTGYAGGLDKKRWLLAHEGALLV